MCEQFIMENLDIILSVSFVIAGMIFSRRYGELARYCAILFAMVISVILLPVLANTAVGSQGMSVLWACILLLIYNFVFYASPSAKIKQEYTLVFMVSLSFGNLYHLKWYIPMDVVYYALLSALLYINSCINLTRVRN